MQGYAPLAQLLSFLSSKKAKVSEFTNIASHWLVSCLLPLASFHILVSFHAHEQSSFPVVIFSPRFPVPYMMELKRAWAKSTDLTSWNPKKPCFSWKYVNCRNHSGLI